jgi:hypothetical protein
MPFTKGDPRAKLIGTAGARKRWAYASASDRAKQGETMRAGITRKYIEKARVLAATQGLDPTEAQLQESARLLWDADLAHRRYLAYEALNGARQADSTTPDALSPTQTSLPEPTVGRIPDNDLGLPEAELRVLNALSRVQGERARAEAKNALLLAERALREEIR